MMLSKHQGANIYRLASPNIFHWGINGLLRRSNVVSSSAAKKISANEANVQLSIKKRRLNSQGLLRMMQIRLDYLHLFN